MGSFFRGIVDVILLRHRRKRLDVLLRDLDVGQGGPMLFELVQGLFPPGVSCAGMASSASPPAPSSRPFWSRSAVILPVSTERETTPWVIFSCTHITSDLRRRTYRGSPGKCSSCRWWPGRYIKRPAGILDIADIGSVLPHPVQHHTRCGNCSASGTGT